MATSTLTSEQMAAAIALYLRLEELRCSGLKFALVQLPDKGAPIGVRSVGKRVDVVVPEDVVLAGAKI